MKFIKRLIAPLVVPRGMYCYTARGPFYSENGTLIGVRTNRCPFWGSIRSPILDGRGEFDGYCWLLDTTDITLWDQLKICGINEDDEDLE
jgi:hypothetical protein